MSETKERFEYRIQRTIPGSSFYNLHMEELNAMGKDSWEAFAVTLDGDNGENNVYHLKRKLTTEERVVSIPDVLKSKE